MLTTLYLLLLQSSYLVHPRSSWDAHHPLPTATPEQSKFILSTSQDHPGILTTLYLLLLKSIPSSCSVHHRSSWDAHHPLPTATPEQSEFMLSTSQIILGYSPPSTYCYSRVLQVHTHTYIPGSSWVLTTLYLCVATPSSLLASTLTPEDP